MEYTTEDTKMWEEHHNTDNIQKIKQNKNI